MPQKPPAIAGRREAVEARLLPPECRKAFGKGAAGDLKAG